MGTFGNTFSNSLGGREMGVPPNGIPSNLVLTALSSTSIKCSWTIGSTNQSGHKVYISTDNISYSLAGTVSGTTSEFTASGLSEAVLYYFYVVAYVGSSLSDSSGVASSYTWGYATDLSLNYTGRSGSVVTESSQGLNASLLSPCYQGNGASYYSIASKSIGTSHTIRIGADISLASTTQAILYSASGMYLSIEPQSKRFNYRINSVSNYLTFTTLASGYHEYKIVRNSTSLILYQDDVQIATQTLASDIVFSFTTLFKISSTYTTIPIFKLQIDNLFCLIFNNIYKPQDTMGITTGFNANGLTDACKVYSPAGGGLHDLGYSVWSNGTTEYQIPMYNGVALSSLEANYFTGYTKQYDVVADTNSIFTELDGRIDFDPNNTANSLLDNFNLANTTRFADTARLWTGYNSSESYRWRFSDLADPRIYMAWLNVGYRGMNHSFITIENNEPSKINSILSYSVDKTNSDEWNIMLLSGAYTYAQYPDGSYDVDGNGYVTFISIAYSDDFGTLASNTAYQNSTIINGLVSSGLYSKVVIGSSATDVYLISQPICPDNIEIEYNCILRMMDSVTDILATDISAGALTFTATDASKFHTGEYICVTDDNQLQVYSTYRGWAGKILNIVGNVITLNVPSAYSYTTSANGRIATLQSVILISEASYVTISQTGGYIDGNRTGQAAYHPTYFSNSTIVEAYSVACGIAGWKSSHVTISDGVIVRNAPMHGISFSSDYTEVLNQNITIGDVEVYNAHDKGMHFKWCETVSCGDILVDGVTWEDGIMCYAQNTDFTFGNITTNNCGRTGFGWNNVCVGLTASSITTANCTDYGVSIFGKNATVTNIVTSDRIIFSDIYAAYTNGGVSNVNITSIDIDNNISALTTPVVLFHGNVDTITIGTLTITGCTGIGVQATAYNSLYPETVVVNAGGIYSHTGALTDIQGSAGVTLTGDFA